MSAPRGPSSTQGGAPSAPAIANANANAGKKAVHVKWAGKTIALGTFPSAEADEKCARAKALTRAWRSTMRPKPTREWVMAELERLGVRVVSGRLGRKAGEDDDDPQAKPPQVDVRSAGVPAMDRKNSMGWGSNADLDSLMQRRSSSLGLSMLNDDMNRRSSLSSLGPVLGLDAGNMGDPTMPPHRPLVGGGAAAAYEAARADHYAQKREEQQRRASSLGLGAMGGGGGMPQMGLSVNPNQHYEMLKLHHMNLLNEIQETTLMMNLYQQQQLQQQQQQLQQQQQASESGGGDQMSMLLQQQGAMDNSMYGSGPMGPGGSMGMGGVPGNDMGMMRQQQQQQQQQRQQQQQQMMQQQSGSHSAPTQEVAVPSARGAGSLGGNKSPAVDEELQKREAEQKALEEQLQKLKDEIARSKKEAEELQKLASQAKTDDDAEGGEKRKAEDNVDGEAKKVKTEDQAEDKTEDKQVNEEEKTTEKEEEEKNEEEKN
mmetsp:Transcript_10270/g.18173  ORF Transcript_10270/g.18173 Transcript_10270/m.18173 type:complete len:487 (+) Transcript_10270:102-1562(+)